MNLRRLGLVALALLALTLVLRLSNREADGLPTTNATGPAESKATPAVAPTNREPSSSGVQLPDRTSESARQSPKASLSVAVNKASGAPIPLATVTLTSQIGATTSAMTNASGDASFMELEPMVGTVHVQHGEDREEIRDITILAGECHQVTVVFAARSRLRVLVRTEQGTPVEGATVSIQGHSSLWVPRTGSATAPRQSRATDPQGVAEFRHVSGAPVLISVEKAGFYAAPRTIRLGEEEETEVLIVGAPGELVSLLVIEKGTHQPIPGIPIHINWDTNSGVSDSEAPGIRVTDHEGRLRFCRPEGVSVSCFIRGSLRWQASALIPLGVHEIVLEAESGEILWCLPVLPPSVPSPAHYEVQYATTWHPRIETKLSRPREDGAIPIEAQGFSKSPQFRIVIPEVAASTWQQFEKTRPQNPVPVTLHPWSSIEGRVAITDPSVNVGSIMIEVFSARQAFVQALEPPMAKPHGVYHPKADGRFEIPVPRGSIYELRIRGGRVLGSCFRLVDLTNLPKADLGTIEFSGAGTAELEIMVSGRPFRFGYGWLVSPKSFWDVGDTTRVLFRADHLGRATVEGLYPSAYEVVLSGPHNEPPDVVPGNLLSPSPNLVRIQSGLTTQQRIVY